jgi:ligand-binding SRPBCC domain-containing protein
MPRIELTLSIAAPPERCFDLARSVEAHLHSARGTGEEVVGGRRTGLMELGDEVTWRARHLGLRLRLQSRITAFDRPRHFRDSMVRGPLARLDHDHHFMPDGRGGTVMRDVFDFRAPLGPLGRIAEWLWLERHFRRFLEVRNEALRQLAESDGWRRFLPV